MMFRIKKALFVMALILLAGCASTEPSRFHNLTPMPGSSAETQAEYDENDIAIGIGPVNIPDYLDREQIVTRNNQNEIELGEFNRWAGELQENVAGILFENLSHLLSTDRVSLYPWRGTTPIDFQIEVEILQLDGEMGGNVLLVSHWTILGGDNQKVLMMKKSSFTEPSGAQGYNAFVAAQSRALENLSRQISLAIELLSR